LLITAFTADRIGLRFTTKEGRVQVLSLLLI
jgi:hypothetical protein